MGRNSLNLLNFIKALPLFLMLGIALAQTAEEIVNTIISVGIIVVVIMILLYLGGVWKPGKGTLKIPWGLVIYIILIIVIFVLPILQRIGMIKIFPDTLDEAFQSNPDFYETYQKSFMMQRLPSPICNVFKYLAIDERIACYMPAFLYFFLIPFVAIYAITWGFLTQIQIFSGETKRLNPLIAFIIAFMTLPMGVFLILLAFWFSVLGAFSIAVFVAMFLAGVFLRGYGFTIEKYAEVKVKEYSSYLKRKEAAREALREAWNTLLKAKGGEKNVGVEDLKELIRRNKEIFEIATGKNADEFIKDITKDNLQNKIEEVKSYLS